jgi:hypothetical protein
MNIMTEASHFLMCIDSEVESLKASIRLQEERDTWMVVTLSVLVVLEFPLIAAVLYLLLYGKG